VLKCRVIKARVLLLPAMTSQKGKASGRIPKYRATGILKSFDHISAAAMMVGFGGLSTLLAGFVTKSRSRQMVERCRGSTAPAIEAAAGDHSQSLCSDSSISNLLDPLQLLQATQPIQIQRLEPLSVRLLVCREVFVAAWLQSQTSRLADADHHDAS